MSYAHQFSVLATHLQILIGEGGYALLFLCTLLEGVPVLGMAIPGHISIIIAGFFARIGVLDLWWVMIISIVGAILGDYIGFSLGKKYGMSFIARIRPYFFSSDAYIDKAQALLGNHTGKAMIIGRFTPATRALMPFLVGASHTPARKFWFFNIIGGVSWTVISVLVGYVFGAGYHAAAGYFGRVLVVAIIFVAIIIWGYRFVNSHFHIFKRYEIFTLSLNILSLIFLAITVQDAFSAHSYLANFDIWVSNFMDMHNHGTFWSNFIGSLATEISTVGGTVVMIALGIMVAVQFSFEKRWRSVVIVLASIGTTGVLIGVIKEFFLRQRPVNALTLIINDPSFPSGHAGMAAAFFTVFAYLVAPKVHSWIKRELFLASCVLVVILIGLSRIVLNVHWTSDVIAGWSLGIFMTTASILIVKYIGILLTKKLQNQ